MPDNEEEKQINREIEGFKKKQDLNMEELDATFDAVDPDIQRDALQGLGKLSEEVGGDTQKLKEQLEEEKRIIAERLGIRPKGVDQKGKGR